jgi:hypothetical protein
MSLKKSNREGTGKKHECLSCKKLIPLYKKYCSRQCYNKEYSTVITCKHCNKIKKVPKHRSNDVYCSIQCSNQNIDRKQTRNKAIKTIIKKYGVNNPFEVVGYNNLNIDYKKRAKNQKQTINNKPEAEKQAIRNKISQTLLSKSEDEKQIIKIKKEQTNLLRYGSKCTLNRESILFNKVKDKHREAIKQNLDQWLLNNNLILLDEYKGVKDKDGSIIYYNFQHVPSQNIFLDHIACGRMPIYKDPTQTIGISSSEKEIQDFISSIYKGTKIFNTRGLIKGFEIDIFFPELNLAIEFDGLKWHSELNGKNREYHLNKTETLLKQNIQLIHIFEDEWKYKKDIVKSRITNLLRLTPNIIYARKCKIKEISHTEANNFYQNTHIQGKCKPKINIGLYYNDILVASMSFGNLRKVTGNTSQYETYELLRYSTLLNTNIPGGFSKILKYFQTQYKPKNIISYSDRRWSNGEVYKKNGFKFIYNTPPNYWYMKYYKEREHRFKYRKSELSKLLDKFDKDKSEWENMKNNKYDRIWDCGSGKWMFC